MSRAPFGKLGEKGLVAFITFLSAFIPLSTDIYLPALPGMARQFATSAGMVNMTLVGFFACFALSTLFWGPLSDKIGRKRALQSGLTLYVLASVGCVFSVSIGQLIVFRILQAMGGGCANAVSTAIVKDAFHVKKKRETVMALSMSAAMVAPIVAPVLGAFLLQLMSWRILFVVLAALGGVGLWGACVFTETLPLQKRHSGLGHALGRLGSVAKNPGFAMLLLTFSLMAVPMIGFVSGSAYIYIGDFGLSEQHYSYFFALNALFIVLGPLFYVKFGSFLNPRKMVGVCFLVTALCGILVCLVGPHGPWSFALALIPATLSGSFMRPYTINLMLEQQKGDAGSASSLINSAFQVLGCLGMALISLDWSSRVVAFGMMYAVVALVCLLLWVVYLAKTGAAEEPVCATAG